MHVCVCACMYVCVCILQALSSDQCVGQFSANTSDLRLQAENFQWLTKQETFSMVYLVSRLNIHLHVPSASENTWRTCEVTPHNPLPRGVSASD